MPTELPSSNPSLERALHEISELRRWTGPAKEFWPRLLLAFAGLTNATKAVILLQDSTQPGKWKRIGDWSSNQGPAQPLVDFTAKLEQIAQQCLAEGDLATPLRDRRDGQYAAACRLKLQRADDVCMALLLLGDISEAAARECLLRLTLVADVPAAYQANLASQQARGDVEKFAATLDLMVLVNAEKRFLGAALALCNGVATRFNSERVSLGWLENGYIRLRAISRTEKFDRQMGAVRALEVAMEEALDQDEEVLWPAPEDANMITRDHDAFAKAQSPGNICSLPLRLDGKAIAVMTCERQSTSFNPTELQQLRLTCDQAARRLSELKQHDRWFGARAASAAREKLSKTLGPEHTWAKVLSLVIATALIVLFLVPFNYRVEGNFVLRSDDVSFLTAPFDGYIDQVFVRPGDSVPKGGKLVGLKTTELELDQSSGSADLTRYQREAEKARATKNLAEMRIALALAEQAKARLELIRYRLEQASIKAAFDGVVVEGDLRERLGAPVKQGDGLFKLARVDTLYVEAEVKERDIHEIINRKNGEIAFVSQPKLKYPIHITTIEPAAVPKNDGNVFLVRCELQGGAQPWWRPGMSGLCKLSVEKRSLFWMLTHRTVDFLRMWLWW
jgi:multidrug resistance efflux pump